ncbi:RWD domain-containing protein 2A-like [Babylonia areolata]|uniref:RWD domain-containing protein 2A-like n=1 Tax=Babylonia areolata TaxID=304850 RepID=UPI003FCF31A0
MSGNKDSENIQDVNGKEDSTDVSEMLQLQLAEVEMLESMFANPGEFTLDNQSVLDELRAFVEGTIDYDVLESRVGFTIKMMTTSSPSYQLELICHFPHEYPSIHPEVFIRAPAMGRTNHRHLSENLYKYVASLDTGYILVGSLVEWLQQNAHIYLTQEKASARKGSAPESDKKEESFTRLWIYSHHIYSKFKRQDILDWATELGLKGFSMPGKPGVICVEGCTEDVDEFWYRIRRLNWKRLMIKEQEVKEVQGQKIAELCRFSKFQELELEVVGGKGRSYHMDLGKFYEFLHEHDSAYIFPMYFGVEGKNVGD